MSSNYITPPTSLPPGSEMIGYVRDSGGTDQELSTARQISELTRWSHENGITITRFFIDEARSGRTVHKRDEFKKMLEYLRTGHGPEKGVVICSWERFARNVVQAQLYRSEIREFGYVFHSITDYVPDGPEGFLIEAVKDYAAQRYSEILAESVRSGLHSVLQRFGGLGGFPPRGFMREPIEIGSHRDGRPRVLHRWVPDPDLAPTVILAFQMRARGATLKQIMDATRLFSSINSFTTFFSNRLYMGTLVFGDQVIENYCDPIVSPELWSKVQDVNQSRRKISTDHNPRRLASQFLLSGIAFCQRCGSPLSAHVVQKKGGDRREYYSCTRRARRRDCDAREIPRHTLEAQVISTLEDIALDLERLLVFQARVQEHYSRMFSQVEGERRLLGRELRDATRRIENLVGAIADRGHSHSMIDALHKAELDQSTLKQRIEKMDEAMRPPQINTPLQLAAIASEIKSALQGDDLSRKKNAVRMLTTRIIASRTDKRVNGVLYYVPTVCVGSGTPAGVLAEDIQFTVKLPKRAYHAVWE